MPAAYAEDVAIVLPRKHCAVIVCAWCGDDKQAQAMHIVNGHMDLLQESMEAYRQYKTMMYDNDAVLALSISNESLPIAIRRGAPLASYSIDRRCLQACVTHLTHSETATFVFLAALDNFHVHTGQKEIQYGNTRLKMPRKRHRL